MEVFLKDKAYVRISRKNLRLKNLFGPFYNYCILCVCIRRLQAVVIFFRCLFQQLLGLLFGGGSGVDHGILLCCYFAKLNIRSWLLLGTGVSRGEAAYVLTCAVPCQPSATPVYDVWDPLTGQKYSTCDSFSPIQEAYCLMNSENVSIYVGAIH